jgi:hypothetical protein
MSCGMTFKTMLVHCYEYTSKAWPQVADRPAGNHAVAPVTTYPFQWLEERICRVLTSMNNDKILNGAFGL